LLEQRSYSGPDDIADAPDTVLTLTVGGTTYEHRAYALGFEEESDDPERAALWGYVELVSQFVSGQPGEVLGPESPFESARYLLRSYVADDLDGFEIEPTVLDWPADAPVRLAEAGECASVPAATFGELFTTATQLTFFVDGGVTYRVAVKPVLPGDAAC
jgi:hypothetical protein